MTRSTQESSTRSKGISSWRTDLAQAVRNARGATLNPPGAEVEQLRLQTSQAITDIYVASARTDERTDEQENIDIVYEREHAALADEQGTAAIVKVVSVVLRASASFRDDERSPVLRIAIEELAATTSSISQISRYTSMYRVEGIVAARVSGKQKGRVVENIDLGPGSLCGYRHGSMVRAAVASVSNARRVVVAQEMVEAVMALIRRGRSINSAKWVVMAAVNGAPADQQVNVIESVIWAMKRGAFADLLDPPDLILPVWMRDEIPFDQKTDISQAIAETALALAPADDKLAVARKAMRNMSSETGVRTVGMATLPAIPLSSETWVRTVGTAILPGLPYNQQRDVIQGMRVQSLAHSRTVDEATSKLKEIPHNQLMAMRAGMVMVPTGQRLDMRIAAMRKALPVTDRQELSTEATDSAAAAAPTSTDQAAEPKAVDTASPAVAEIFRDLLITDRLCFRMDSAQVVVFTDSCRRLAASETRLCGVKPAIMREVTARMGSAGAWLPSEGLSAVDQRNHCVDATVAGHLAVCAMSRAATQEAEGFMNAFLNGTLDTHGHLAYSSQVGVDRPDHGPDVSATKQAAEAGSAGGSGASADTSAAEGASDADAGSSASTSSNAGSPDGISSGFAGSSPDLASSEPHKGSLRPSSGGSYRSRSSSNDDHARSPYSHAYGLKEHGMSSIDFLLQTYGIEWLKGWLDKLQHALNSLHCSSSFAIARRLDELPQNRGLLDQDGDPAGNANHDSQSRDAVFNALENICPTYTSAQPLAATDLLAKTAGMFVGFGAPMISEAGIESLGGSDHLIGVIVDNSSAPIGAEA